jgi:hypothetical protein
MVSSRAAIYALTALAAGSIALAPLPLSGASSNSISFETPTIVDPIHTNGEPDIAIDPPQARLKQARLAAPPIRAL